jgi:hypothetical protein
VIHASRKLFTVGVFQDVGWAERGIEALLRGGFSAEVLSVLAKDTEEASALFDRTVGRPEKLELGPLGQAVGRGPLVAALQGDDRALASQGVAATIRRAGFQAHDGTIFETLIGRGGVLVAIRDDRRAADALATLHAYGAGNAAIGAWAGRV